MNDSDSDGVNESGLTSPGDLLRPPARSKDPKTEPRQPDEKVYNAFCTQVAREDKLINNRLSWLLTSEGLLFGALALMATTNANNDVNVSVVEALKKCIPIIGIIIPASALVSILAAHRVTHKLQQEWKIIERYFPNHPTPFGGHNYSIPVLGPSITLPVAMIGAWLFIIWQIKPF